METTVHVRILIASEQLMRYTFLTRFNVFDVVPPVVPHVVPHVVQHPLTGPPPVVITTYGTNQHKNKTNQQTKKTIRDY